MEIGAQLYTIREFCQTKEDFSESLKKVADIGYKNVQVSGTCEFEAAWLKYELQKNGLKCVLTHTPAEKLKTNTKQICDEHTEFGCNYIGLGYYQFRAEENKLALENFQSEYLAVAETLRENGKYFMYHNHDMEFQKIGGKTILEHLAGRFSPDIMGFILDTFWVQAGGGDPAQWVEKFQGRVPCIHLKDYSFGRKMEVIGEGNINFDRVFEKAETAGTKYMLVEQDDCNGENPFDCLKRSYEYLKSRGFE